MIEVGESAMVEIDLIEVGDRVREDMGDLNDLEGSMKESGLITPIAVKKSSEGRFFLLAGERRLRVLRKNETKKIPVRIYPEDISDLQVKIIENSENFHRKDLEYWEYDNSVREIHRLQQELHGSKAPGPGHEGWSVEDTGGMIGMSKGSVSTAIKRAQARDAYPELFEDCRTQKDASTLMKKMDEALLKRTLAEKLQASKTETSIAQYSKAFVVGNFFEKVKEVPDRVINLVEIDPPYSIEITKAKKKEGESIYTLGDYNEVPSNSYMDGMPGTEWEGLKKVLKESYRVMTEHSWLICWFAPEPWFNEVYKAILEAGFQTTRMCGIWPKPSGQSKRPELYLPNSYEMFFYAWKGRPAIARQRSGNWFDYSPVSPDKKTHPTERPVELTDDIYETFAFPGSRILIPFLGSGNGIISAMRLKMSVLGYDMSAAYRDSFLVKMHNLIGQIV